MTGAGFKIVDVHDSTEESQHWFEAMAARMAQGAAPIVTFQAVLGKDFPEMARNQVKALANHPAASTGRDAFPVSEERPPLFTPACGYSAR